MSTVDASVSVHGQHNCVARQLLWSSTFRWPFASLHKPSMGSVPYHTQLCNGAPYMNARPCKVSFISLQTPATTSSMQGGHWTPTHSHWENSLFDTGKMSHSFLGPEIFFIPYLTLTSTFIHNLTLPSNPLANGVNWLLKRRFCP